MKAQTEPASKPQVMIGIELPTITLVETLLLSFTVPHGMSQVSSRASDDRRIFSRCRVQTTAQRTLLLLIGIQLFRTNSSKDNGSRIEWGSHAMFDELPSDVAFRITCYGVLRAAVFAHTPLRFVATHFFTSGKVADLRSTHPSSSY